MRRDGTIGTYVPHKPHAFKVDNVTKQEAEKNQLRLLPKKTTGDSTSQGVIIM